MKLSDIQEKCTCALQSRAALDESSSKEKWPTTFSSPFHADYALMDLEGYCGVWTDGVNDPKPIRDNYRTLLERAVADGKPVSYEGWCKDLRNPVPSNYVRQGDTLNLKSKK